MNKVTNNEQMFQDIVKHFNLKYVEWALGCDPFSIVRFYESTLGNVCHSVHEIVEDTMPHKHRHFEVCDRTWEAYQEHLTALKSRVNPKPLTFKKRNE